MSPGDALFADLIDYHTWRATADRRPLSEGTAVANTLVPRPQQDASGETSQSRITDCIVLRARLSISQHEQLRVQAVCHHVSRGTVHMTKAGPLRQSSCSKSTYGNKAGPQYNKSRVPQQCADMFLV